jgi:hypothetical protein
MDLTDAQYAHWFLSEKIIKGVLQANHALNDFVLFRVAFSWPRGAKWYPDEDDILSADFSLTNAMAADLTDMADEGLSDGYRTADWYARVAAVYHAQHCIALPDSLGNFLQRRLFLKEDIKRGRKRHAGVDRDRVIRNAFEGLRARGCATQISYEIIAADLNMTADAVRKLIVNTPKTERENRLWGAILNPSALPQLFLKRISERKE